MGKDLIAPWCSGSMQISEQRALDCSKALTKRMRKKPCDGGSKDNENPPGAIPFIF